MSLTLYAHPFSSYCQKVLIALWEAEVDFTYRHLEDEGVGAALKAVWPFGLFPVLVDDGETVAESSIIIEHCALHHPGRAAMIPAEAAAALPIRFLDRFFDHFVMAAMQKPVAAAMQGDEAVRAAAMATAQAALDTAYDWLEPRIGAHRWAAGDDFTMADCAAAPALFYADWVHPIGDGRPALAAYRARLLARPTVARAVDEGRPYRHYFPLGAPDRD